MKITQKGIDLICQFEAFEANPYVCPAGKNTIGYGTTLYKSGKKVEITDPPITKEQASSLFAEIAPEFEKAVNDLVKVSLTQYQFNALFCFAYNVGRKGFATSTLLRIVNTTPNNKERIIQAFLMWKGKDNRLLTRQQKQIKHYFL